MRHTGVSSHPLTNNCYKYLKEGNIDNSERNWPRKNSSVPGGVEVEGVGGLGVDGFGVVVPTVGGLGVVGSEVDPDRDQEKTDNHILFHGN